jgi:hypothetical protein
MVQVLRGPSQKDQFCIGSVVDGGSFAMPRTWRATVCTWLAAGNSAVDLLNHLEGSRSVHHDSERTEPRD